MSGGMLCGYAARTLGRSGGNACCVAMIPVTRYLPIIDRNVEGGVLVDGQKVPWAHVKGLTDAGHEVIVTDSVVWEILHEFTREGCQGGVKVVKR